MKEAYPEVAKNIYQVVLPLPFALNSVNCYLLADDESWTVVDTGLNTPQGQAAWQSALTALDIPLAAIKRIILTHSHPDHYGLAGWFQNLYVEDSSAMPPVWMSQIEAGFAQRYWAKPPGWFEMLHTFFIRCGLPLEIVTETISQVEGVGQQMLPLPQRVEILEPGISLAMGGRDFQVIHTPGHSDGHLVFYDAADRLMLCGDQVLMKITPNISRWSHGEANPLQHYLTSLRKLAPLEVRLALPGHRALITDWQGRLAELEAHHDRRLERMLAATQPGDTAYQVSQQIFNYDKLSTHEIRFAVAETLAHLEYLVSQNQLRRSGSEIWRYRH